MKCGRVQRIRAAHIEACVQFIPAGAKRTTAAAGSTTAAPPWLNVCCVPPAATQPPRHPPQTEPCRTEHISPPGDGFCILPAFSVRRIGTDGTKMKSRASSARLFMQKNKLPDGYGLCPCQSVQRSPHLPSNCLQTTASHSEQTRNTAAMQVQQPVSYGSPEIKQAACTPFLCSVAGLRLERFCLCSRHKSVHKLLNFTIQHPWQAVQRQIDTVICHTALREIIGTDAFGAVA